MKKFFTTLLLLVLMAPFAMQADEVVIGTGTDYDTSVPFNTGYSYSWNETIYPGTELGGACTINSIAFNCNANESIGTLTLSELDVYIAITQRETISSTLDWTPANELTLVYSGENVVIGDNAWETINFQTPFYYPGEGNLVVVVAKKLYGYNPNLKWFYTSADNTVLHRRNDSTESIADEHPGSNLGIRMSFRANIKLDVTYGSVESPIVLTPNSIDMGHRPSGAWMSPKTIEVTTEGEATTISSITSTNPFFVFTPVELPYELTTETPLTVKVSHLAGNNGEQTGELIFNHSFGSDAVQLTATAYTASISDVWEMPKVVDSYPFTETPVFDNLYNNYNLPGDEQDGADAVYRLNFQEETTFSAKVNGENGKVALYATHFNGKGGPDFDNYYGAPMNPEDSININPEVQGNSFFYDFDDTTLDGWRTIDADGDYYTWKSSYNIGAYGYNETECIASESYSTTANAALNPDNYIVTNGLYSITENSTLSFYALPLDPWYSEEHYGVAVSVDGINFVTIWEHTVDYTEVADWAYKTVSLANYAGHNVYIALRHFNCTNEYAILIDNVELSAGTRSEQSNEIKNMTVPAGVYYLAASATEQFTITVNTTTEGGYNSVSEVVAEIVDDNKAKAYWSWDFIDAKRDNAAFSHYKVYRKNEFIGNEETLLADNVTDTVYVDNTWGAAANGSYRYGVSVVYNDAKYETPIVWSNNIDKGINVAVTVNVETENDASVEGAHVSFVNVDYPNFKYETTLNATGSYTWNEFRIGTYDYTISLEGYNTSSATIEIADATTIDCILKEIFVLGDLYVSPTGWAMWEEDSAETFTVKLDGTTVAEVFSSGYQFDVTNLVEGQEYTATVLGESELEYTWTYRTCDNFVEATDYEVVVNGTNVELSWTLPIGASPSEFMYDFEDGTLDGFITIDANGDGRIWGNSTQFSTTDCGYESTNCAVSRSYDGMYNLTPDDYMVTERKYAITDNSKLTFYAAAENSMWAAEHYGVAISTTTNDSPSEFTVIWEETMTAKGDAKAVRNERAPGQWYFKTVDLSDYAGQNVYIALRHFNCEGQFWLKIDDLTLTANAKDEEPNTTDLEVLGAMVYRNGELLTSEPLKEESFVDVNPGYGDMEYSIRVVFGGDADSYYAMSCPQSETVTVARVCDAPRNLYGEESINENGEFGASLVWPYTMQGSEWLYYDDGVNVTGIGLGTPSPIYFGIMFPGETLATYEGTYITKISLFDYEAHEGNLNIYYGGDNAPETMVHTQPYSCTALGSFRDLELTAPLPVDPSMNLWIVFNSINGSYPAPGCMTTGDPNGRWISLDGTTWQDVTTAGTGLDYTWMIRAFVTSDFKSDMELGSKENIFEHYNVYRSTSNSNYELIGETTEGKYFDIVEPGTYYYQVTAVYTIDGEECESVPANAYESEDNYVVVDVTSIDENGVNGIMIYPNPAKDFVKLSAISGQLSVVRIYNSLGMLINEIEMNSEEIEINVSDYNQGIYFISIETENGNVTKKIIKD